MRTTWKMGKVQSGQYWCPHSLQVFQARAKNPCFLLQTAHFVMAEAYLSCARHGQYPPEYLAMMEDKARQPTSASGLEPHLLGDHIRMTYPIAHEQAEIRRRNIVLDAPPQRMQAGMVKAHQGPWARGVRVPDPTAWRARGAQAGSMRRAKRLR